jgi:hypothetical protein
MLIFKKNELKRLVRNSNNNYENSIEKIDSIKTKKIINRNGDVSHLFSSIIYNFIKMVV